jgi:cadmium resistance protein CadD (predicted permease)
VAGGALLAVSVMIALLMVAAVLADFVPTLWLGWLGLIPLALGLRELVRLRARVAGADATGADALPPIGAVGIAGVLLAHSGDSFGALAPLFAETRRGLLPLIAAVVLVLTLLACALARWIVSHPRVGPAIRSVAPRLVPFVLIAVGLYVLTDSPTDTFP